MMEHFLSNVYYYELHVELLVHGWEHKKMDLCAQF